MMRCDAIYLYATTVLCLGEFSNTSTPTKPHSLRVSSRSMVMYSDSHGSVLLNAAKAKGFAANFWKNMDLGFMSIIEIAPPEGSTRQASVRICLLLA